MTVSTAVAVSLERSSWLQAQPSVAARQSAASDYATFSRRPVRRSVGSSLENVVEGSSVRTDGFRQYSRISSLGYEHVRVVVGDPKKASKLFPRVHRVSSLLDRWLLGTLHGSIRRQHLQRYLDDFVFRFNRRSATARALLFERLIGAVFRSVPTYLQLTTPEPLLVVGA